MRWRSCGTRLWSEPVDAAQDVREQVPGNGNLCDLEGDLASVSDNLAADPVTTLRQRGRTHARRAVRFVPPLDEAVKAGFG
jgi:hypothetical protein